MPTAQRSFERERIAKARIADIFSAGVSFHSEMRTISENVQKAIPAKLPTPNRQYLQGYAEAKFEALWQMVEFRYQLADGAWINAHDLEYHNSDCDAECSHTGHYVAKNNPPNAFFWKGTERKFA